MKKLIALILSVVLVMSLTACSGAKTYLSLDKALRNKNYTTQVNVDGSAMESATKDMKLQNVKSAVSISFANEEKNSKSSGFVFVFTFKNKNDAVTAFADALKMYLSMGAPFKTVESANGKKAIYQDGNTAITILAQAGNTVVYSSEYWTSTPKNGIYNDGLGKILEDLGF